MRGPAWWHRLRRHRITVKRVTVPAFDPWARGELIDCECGARWAK